MNQTTPPTRFGVVDRAVSAAMDGLAFLQALRDGSLPAPPISATAALWIVEVEAGRVVFEAQPTAHFYNPLGSVHGGWLATVLDSAMGCAVHSTLAAGQAFSTVDMTVSLVRPVFENTGALRCVGQVVHAGRRIVTAEGRLVDDRERLIAHGSETCIVLAVPDAAA
jgi:uncharacterized protein (TIGR00369 family)